MDLVGPGPVEHHFTDATGAVTNLPHLETWVDLGSGAGFPGIALGAHFPNSQVTLIESRHKRAIFLKQVLRQGKVDNVSVLCDRAENVQGPFDGVISRAYKPPLEFLLDAERLTKVGGYAVCLLGMDGHFTIPNKWVLHSEKTYLISENEGFRKRWVLRRVS